MSETEELPESLQELVELAKKLINLTQGGINNNGQT